ncbi:hypothetical protein AVEN_74038-1 [Araneus ventricosus]|uniref:Uncharacterized protein n=1 Tax=Araneus ventricosus TaxID=182803 RepID=A0A4Y2SN62_ARAVE|nr:hypothetical protein AVEN_56060-1 [Araneus ventricosus]GBN89146.1 hypothetical protein AVEN_74038-1 [Araneus ventricosus]
MELQKNANDDYRERFRIGGRIIGVGRRNFDLFEAKKVPNLKYPSPSFHIITAGRICSRRIFHASSPIGGILSRRRVTLTHYICFYTTFTCAILWRAMELQKNTNDE